MFSKKKNKKGYFDGGIFGSPDDKISILKEKLMLATYLFQPCFSETVSMIFLRRRPPD